MFRRWQGSPLCTTAWLAAAGLICACHELPPLVSQADDPNISGQCAVAGPLMVALDGVLPGCRVTLAINGNDVLANYGNGNQTVIAAGEVDAGFQVDVQSAGPGLSCLPTSIAGVLTTAPQVVHITCTRRVLLTQTQPAAWVIGQPDFTSSGANNATNALSGPASIAYAAATEYLYVADYTNNRVSVFSPPTHQGPDTTFIIGAQTAFTYPNHVSINGNQMVVANYGASQIWLYQSLPTMDGPPDLVIGGNAGQCMAGSFNGPSAAFITDDKRLLVADRNNHRVLLYNALPNAGGVAAVALGQPDMAHCLVNQGGNTASPSTLYVPDDVWSDGNNVFVSDSYNNRVLYWSSWPVTDAQPATSVLGQPDFQSNAASTTANGLAQPRGLVSDGTNVYVADFGNSRVLGFTFLTQDTPPGPPATWVLGQADFTSGVPNAGRAASQTSLKYPLGLAFLNTSLVVADQSNNRVLVYTSH